MTECPILDSGPLLGWYRASPSWAVAASRLTDTPLQISHIYTLPRLFTETMTSAVSSLLGIFYSPVLILYGSLNSADDDSR